MTKNFTYSSVQILETIMDTQKFFLHSFLLILHFTSCSSKDTITINQTIQDGELLISKENNFVLGFFSPGNSKFRYLGIWYYKVPEQTVVWVANRNNPINGSSGVLSINQYGNLILYGNTNQKVPLWSTNVSVEVTYTPFAQLLDSGNLVLAQERSKKIVWQSFDYPTDTLLPGMKQGFNWKTGMHYFRTSWRSADDPGSGEYSIGINPKGSPQHFLYKGTKPCWRSMPWPVRNYVDVRNFSFVNNEDEVYLTYFLADTSLILRIVLDYSGLDKHLTWHESDGKWKETWSIPRYQCESYGHCGTYGKCDPLRLNRRFECDCLPGYEPKSPRDWNILKDASGGCVRKRLESSSLCGDGEGFVKVANVKVPDASVAVWLSMNMSPMDCEQECKKKCSCSAYASMDITGKGTGCLAWFGELIDTVAIDDEGYDLYVRVDALELANNVHKTKSFLGMKGMLPLLVLSGVSTWLVIILFAYMLLQKKKRRVTNKWKKRLLDTLGDAYCQKGVVAVNEVGDSTSHLDIAIFYLSTILVATNNFAPANKLGQGGFGSVYKGQLTNGQEVAVKRLDKNSLQGIEEFKNEVILISKLQHKNLVKLLGCCIQGEEPMLIYEFLPNKSLDSLLFDETRRSILDWRKRFDIIIGIARGILYLHQDSRLRIIHRDLKASNILLDAEMNPKVSDFGMARLFKSEQIQEKTSKVVGTFGYMAPEYVIFGKFSMKSDVFSYGVILLEIITGMKNNGLCKEDLSLSLIEYVWELWRENRAMEILDSSLKESYALDEVLRCIQIGLLCVQEDEMNRPTMFTVVLMLNSEISLPPPKQPAFILGRSYSNPNSQIRKDISCFVDEMTITNVVSR